MLDFEVQIPEIGCWKLKFNVRFPEAGSWKLKFTFQVPFLGSWKLKVNIRKSKVGSAGFTVAQHSNYRRWISILKLAPKGKILENGERYLLCKFASLGR